MIQTMSPSPRSEEPATTFPRVVHRGCTFHATRTASGEPVLCIQGCGVHGAGWRPQTDALSAQYDCLHFDHRGMGQSQPAGRVSVAQMAEDARVLMEAIGWRSAHVVGHSLG